jgi:hypothetical protein
MLMGKYKIIVVSLPMALAVVGAKIAAHALGWEVFEPSLLPLFTASVTGIIFLLGFILAGVMTDYKESERIPGEMTASAWIIWQEMEIAARGPAGEKARRMQRRLLHFIEIFHKEMLLAKRSRGALDALDAFTGDIAALDREVPPPFMTRVRNEQAALRRHLTRITVIRGTDFAVSVSILVRGIVVFFIAAMLLLRFDPPHVGWFFCFFYSFILVSILRVIGDMDDPFEYREGVEPVDEIDFSPLWEFAAEMRKHPGDGGGEA